MYKFGPVQQKILLVLLGGAALGMASSPRQYFRALKGLRKGWREIDQRNFRQSIRGLSRQKLVEEEVLSNGSFRLVLTAEGKKQARALNLIGRSIRFKKTKKWDGKWRMVLFDIPEKSRLFRDILRKHLYELGFCKLQQSVFVSPYAYEKPLSELVDLYTAKKYVRILTVSWIDNEKKLKRRFFHPSEEDKKKKKIVPQNTKKTK